jgi:hypothetical protein
VLNLPAAVERYTLTVRNLTDRTVQLNGTELKLNSDDALPQLTGVATHSGELTFEPATIHLPQFRLRTTPVAGSRLSSQIARHLFPSDNAGKILALVEHEQVVASEPLKPGECVKKGIIFMQRIDVVDGVCDLPNKQIPRFLFGYTVNVLGKHNT